MFHVYDTNKHASNLGYPWTNSQQGNNNIGFNSFDEAVEYTKAWLGTYGNPIPQNWDGKKFVYAATLQDTIEIREIKIHEALLCLEADLSISNGEGCVVSVKDLKYLIEFLRISPILQVNPKEWHAIASDLTINPIFGRRRHPNEI